MAIKIAERLNYKPEEVFEMPLAKVFFLNSALDVKDGKATPRVDISKEDLEAANFLKDNQNKAIQRMKSRRGKK